MGNMDIYEALATPPNDAVKAISGGNLKGFSDINPQWRYEALTSQFGVCGIGWKYTVDKWFTQEVSTGETMVFVSVSLYIKRDDKWSDPIPAFGGDFLVKKDKYGLHGNDEAMKMAITDALGTAAKMIGVAADVYRGLIAHGASDSKYARREIAAQTAQNRPQAPARPPANMTKGKENEEVRARAMKDLKAEMDRIGLTGQEVSALAGVKFNRTTTKELTTGEICQLTRNLEGWVMEQTGVSA